MFLAVEHKIDSSTAVGHKNLWYIFDRVDMDHKD